MATEILNKLLPASALIVAACLFLLGGRSRRATGILWSRLCLLAFCAAGFVRFVFHEPETGTDPAAKILSWLLLGVGLVSAGMKSSEPGFSRRAAECLAMLMFSIAGAIIVVSADDLVLLMAGLQLTNLPLGVLVFLSGRNRHTVEAVLKFVLAGFLSTALVIYGFVLLYGLAGATDLSDIGRALRSVGEIQSLGVVAVVLIFTGLGIPIAAVPFHFPLTDITDGVDAWTAGVICAVPRIAAAGALVHLCGIAFPVYAAAGVPVLLALSVATVGGGNLAALLQSRVRRMFTYLWIAQAGSLLLCLAAVLWWSGRADAEQARFAVTAAILQLCASTIAITGLFAVLVYTAGKKQSLDYVDELTGLARTQPLVASAAAVFLLSMAGVPPLSGFWSHLATCIAALGVHIETEATLVLFHKGFLTATVIVVWGGVMTAATGVRLIGVMFLEAPLGKPRSCPAWTAKLAIAGAAALIVIAGLVPHLVTAWLRQ